MSALLATLAGIVAGITLAAMAQRRRLLNGRDCPFCHERINSRASKCPCCTGDIPWKPPNSGGNGK